MTINAAAIQFNVKQGDVDANLAYVREALHRVAAQGATLAVLPEMWSSGFAYKNLNELALRTAGIVDELLTLSRELKLVIVGGISFLAGFLGPIILTPQANQGPLVGIFITGPVGFVLGIIAGYIYAVTKHRDKTA